MKKKKIISSLMLTGIVLSSINPMVVLADETTETQSAQNTPSSQTATNNTNTTEDSLSQVGLDTQSSVLTENSEQTKNTKNLTTSNDDISKHVLGNRPADHVTVNGNALGVHDQIRVDRIRQTKNGDTYTVDIDGSIMAETNSHTMRIDYATDTKHTVVDYNPNGHHPVPIESFSSKEEVKYIVIQVETKSSSHALDATYHFTADELPEDTKPV
ncbi:hypothetical protein UA3_02546, partial [Enterococcus faecium EnGen0263]|uniref:hypothetical protein n=1 Tax=Enterococcus faecium TaxID=1352 RepID=UPI00032E6B7F